MYSKLHINPTKASITMQVAIVSFEQGTAGEDDSNRDPVKS